MDDEQEEALLAALASEHPKQAEEEERLAADEPAGATGEETEEARMEREILEALEETEGGGKAVEKSHKSSSDRQKKHHHHHHKEKHEKKNSHKEKRKKTRDGDDSGSDAPKRKSKFIDDAAGEGSEDDVEDDWGSEKEIDLSKQEDTTYIDKHKVRRTFFNEEEDDEGLSEEQIAKKLEARYAREKVEAQHTAAIRRKSATLNRYSSALLPQSSDPKVFAVKCRPGTARSLVARIVNKCYAYHMGWNYEKKPMDLGIISVFSVDHVKEYIYVESHRQLFVEKALNGLQDVFRFKISTVPPKELMSLMEVQQHSKEELQVGNFCRVRQGPYRNDLAQVVEIMPDGKHATVKVVPREDFIGKAYSRLPGKGAPCLPQRFFSSTLAVGAREGPGGRFVWGELMFTHDGYLLKTLSVRGLFYGSKLEKPSIGELARFFKHDPQKVTDAASHSSLTVTKVEHQVGDIVRIVSIGELAGVIGKIVGISRNTMQCTLLCSFGGNKAQMDVPLSAVVRHFQDGTHILVESGEFKGMSGTVLKTVGSNLVFVSDSNQGEFDVRCDDCRKTKMSGDTGMTELGTWALYDLVLLSDGKTVGCITRLHEAQISILTQHNSVLRIHPSEIHQTMRDRVSAMDMFGNPFTRGDAVVLGDGVGHILRGKFGRVEQIFHETAFVHCPEYFENSSLLAVDAKTLTTAGKKNKFKTVTTVNRQLHQIPRKENPATRAEPEELHLAAESTPFPMAASSEYHQ